MSFRKKMKAYPRRLHLPLSYLHLVQVIIQTLPLALIADMMIVDATNVCQKLKLSPSARFLHFPQKLFITPKRLTFIHPCSSQQRQDETEIVLQSNGKVSKALAERMRINRVGIRATVPQIH